MKIGDLVRLRQRYGDDRWDNMFGEVIQKYNSEGQQFRRVGVLWFTTGKVEVYYSDSLEVIYGDR